ncbi:tetratricopeptide repeat protein [Leptolyngbya sp. FACHB-261]|uniref:tetratricopeptide repeat protein n=1 Tax=Leptolyngbya sp. FACHB-261 TaxID=2692806 RepID=UPI001683A977|nr:tetratricopeptide repeat protein [Leptolyngbya sp. FACHB-261]MBD2105049.1 tetratricopeptide repeat protein [Leptolyngbya sp. FACHB-261]
MDSSLAAIYLSTLLAILVVVVILVFRQIRRTRSLETTISRLQPKLMGNKGTPQEYYELGAVYLDKRLYTQATALFQKALKAESEDYAPEDYAPIYNALGFSYFNQEQYDLSIRQYKEALERVPDYATALNNLAHAYEKKKLTVQALEAYEKVLKLEPNNEIARRRANSLRKQVAPSEVA